MTQIAVKRLESLLTKLIPFLGLILIFSRCVPLTPATSQSTKKLVFENHNYEPFVGMVQCYPDQQNTLASIDLPVFQLASNLLLNFDLFQENYTYLNAKYIHCNADWKPSGLSDIQFLNVYNEFPLNQFEYSQNTTVPYVNYTNNLPVPEVSGNYLLVVYGNNNSNDLILSRRILVHETIATINAEVLPSTVVKNRRTHQQVVFDFRYQNINSYNPMRDFKVVLLQNHDWTSAITGLQPTLIRADSKTLVYDHFNGENTFPGWNEYRFFDLRFTRINGVGVESINKEATPIQVSLVTDQSQGKRGYSDLNKDINGFFYLGNNNPGEGPLQATYANVHFYLDADKLPGDVMIQSQAFSGLGGSLQMSFDPIQQRYTAQYLLKQGYYEYRYVTNSSEMPPYSLEGSHFQTNNDYEILIYYTDPVTGFDKLIGYRRLSSRD